MITHAIKIADGKFTQGELSFDIDTKDLAKALQQVDKLTVYQHRELAKLNGIMVEPFDRRLLRPVILGLIQSAWYKAVKGNVPEKVAAKQADRITDYLKQLEDLKNVSADDLVATRSRKASTKAESAPKSASFYTLDYKQIDALLAKDPGDRPKEARLMGQQYVIIETIKNIEAVTKKPGATVAQIAEQVKPNPYVMVPSKTNVSFYINAWKALKLVIVVDEKGTIVGTPAAPAAPAKKK